MAAEAVTVEDLTLVRTADGLDPTPGVDYESRDDDGDNFFETLAILSSTPMTVSGATTRMCLTTGNDTHAVLTIQDLSIDTPSTLMQPALDVGDSWASGTGSLTLTVLGNNLLRSQQAEGICLPFFMSLHITKESTGRLEVTGFPGVNPTVTGAPGIGCTGWVNGPITINGGTIEAQGGYGCAGIGGGFRTNGQDITINGGTVTATSLGGGAGIGGGSVIGSGRSIAINGGVVRATGGMMGAGIGGGAMGGAEDIAVTGGEVWAYGGSVGACGIGGGRISGVENVKITGGFVHAEGSYDDANGGHGSGIGSGSLNNSSANNAMTPSSGFSGRLDGVLGGGSVVVTAPQDYPFGSTDQIAEISFAATPSIDADDLPQGQVGSPYQSALKGSRGVVPYTWSVTAGSLPAGLELDAGTGIVSGTPSEGGEATFTVTLTDAWGIVATSKKHLLIKVAPAPGPDQKSDRELNKLAPTGDKLFFATASFATIALVASTVLVVSRKTRRR